MSIEISVYNVESVSYEELFESIEPYHRMSVPSVVPGDEVDKMFMVLPSYYSYVVGLWSRLDHSVRDHGSKDQITKRDYLREVMHSIKFLYDVTSRRGSLREPELSMTGSKKWGNQ